MAQTQTTLIDPASIPDTDGPRAQFNKLAARLMTFALDRGLRITGSSSPGDDKAEVTVHMGRNTSEMGPSAQIVLRPRIGNEGEIIPDAERIHATVFYDVTNKGNEELYRFSPIDGAQRVNEELLAVMHRRLGL